MNATRKPQNHRAEPAETERADLVDGAQTDGTPNRRADGEFKDTPQPNPPASGRKG